MACYLAPRDPVATLIGALKRNGCHPRRRSANCPAHDDRTPSLTFAEGNDGRALVYCHAGCTVERITAALGLQVRDLFTNRATYRARRRGHDPLIVSVLGQAVAAPAKSCDGVDVPDLPDLDAGVLKVLHGHAFFAPTCCPSQELIGAELDDVIGEAVSQPTVSRTVHRLRRRGLITWRYETAPGARFWHCVYTLQAHWHRPNRRAVIARIRAAKDAVRASQATAVNSKRTALYVENPPGGASSSAGTLETLVSPIERSHDPPSERDWERAFEAVKVSRGPACAIYH